MTANDMVEEEDGVHQNLEFTHSAGDGESAPSAIENIVEGEVPATPMSVETTATDVVDEEDLVYQNLAFTHATVEESTVSTVENIVEEEIPATQTSVETTAAKDMVHDEELIVYTVDDKTEGHA